MKVFTAGLVRVGLAMEAEIAGMLYIPKLWSTDVEGYFYEYGGLALGLAVAREVAIDIPGVAVPLHVTIKLKDILDNQVERIESALTLLAGQEVVCKFSGTREAFTSAAVRGGNSSLQRARLIVSGCSTLEDLRQIVSNHDLTSIRALVLQQCIIPAHGLGLIMVHADGDEVLLEISFGQHRYIYASNRPGSIQHAESTRRDRSTFDLEQVVDVHSLIDLQWLIQRRLSFPVDLEGFFSGGIFIIIQLRPIPPDIVIDSSIRVAVTELGGKQDATVTRFVSGAYDVEGVVFDELPGRAGDERPLIVAKRLGRRPWDDHQLQWRLQHGYPTVVLDTESGFHIAHGPECLPPLGSGRESFKYMGVPWMSRELLLGRHVRVLSDGQVGAFSLMDAH